MEICTALSGTASGGKPNLAENGPVVELTPLGLPRYLPLSTAKHKMPRPLPLILIYEAQPSLISCYLGNISLSLSITSRLIARIKPDLAILSLSQSPHRFNPTLCINARHSHIHPHLRPS